jgi:hypothetical protein
MAQWPGLVALVIADAGEFNAHGPLRHFPKCSLAGIIRFTLNIWFQRALQYTADSAEVQPVS